MARLAVGLVGAAVGSFFGPAGTSIGWALGQAVGGLLEPATKVLREGPRMQDLRVMVSTYGVGIPQYWGVGRGAGNVIWFSGIRETITESTEEAGKGGGGQEVTTRTYSYDCDIAVAVCAGPIAGIRRIWADGKLIYNVGDTASVQDVVQSNAAAGNMMIYVGSETQNPDPTIEAAQGAGYVPAHRGLSYIVWRGLQLEPFGNRVPNFTFEVVNAASTANLATPVAYSGANPGVTPNFGGSETFAMCDQLGNVSFFDSATGALVGACDLNNAKLLDYGTASLTPDRPAWDRDGNAWTFAYGTIGGYLGGWLIGMRANGEAFKAILAYAYSGGGLNSYQLAIDRGSNYAYFGPTVNELYRINLDTAPAYGLGGSSLAHRENLSATGISGYGWNDDRNGRPYWQEVSGGVAYLKWIDGTTVNAVAIPSFNTSDYRTATYRAINFDLDNTPWVQWFEGAGSSRHGVLKKINTDDGSVLQTITLPNIGGAAMTGGIIDWVFAQDGFLYLDYAGGSSGVWRKYEIATGTQLYQTGAAHQSTGNAVGTRYAVFFSVPGASTNGALILEPLPRLSLGSSPALSTVVQEICEQAGLTAGDLNVTALTDSVDGYIIPRPIPARSALEQLQKAYFFDVVESDDVLKFVKRGGASAVSIPVDDLAASLDDQGDEEPIAEITRRDEPQVPWQVTVTAFNKDAAYQETSEYARRLVTRSKEHVIEELPIVLTPARIAQVADVLLYNAHTGRTPYRFKTGPKYAKYEPADVATIDSGSALHRVRITAKREALPLIEWEGVLDVAAAYSSSAVGGSSMADSGSVGFPGPTNLALLDIPILRSEDDNVGFYAAMSGMTDGWRGAVLLSSPDDAAFSQAGSLTLGAIQGTASTALGDSAGNAWDGANTVEVTLNAGTLSSATALDVLNGANTALLGGEIIQFQTAELVSGTKYRLSGLLRGRRGTEQYMGAHAIGERFVLLRSGGLLRVTQPASEIGITRYYRAVSFGESSGSVASRALANEANGLKPLSVAHLNGSRHDPATNDWKVLWVRRARVDWDWRDRVDAPLGETSESYEVDIINTSTLAVVRTLTSSTPTATYTAAQQTTDFGSAQSSIRVRVYQISTTVGRGFVKEANFSG